MNRYRTVLILGVIKKFKLMKLHYLQKANKKEKISSLPFKKLIIFILLTFSIVDLLAQPVIISNGGGATATINVNENTAVDNTIRTLTTVIATDAAGNGSVTYTISGGNDASKFSLTTVGILSFNSTIDYENPGTSNNQYIVIVRATDQAIPTPFYTEQTITVIVNNVNESPVITSVLTANVAENTTYVMTVTATDPDAGSVLSYSIGSTTTFDGAKFTINPTTGVLSFITAPDFESPNDLYGTAGDNIYAVIVKVTDAGIPTASSAVASAAKTIVVKVTDVNDAPTNITLSNNIVAENLPSGTSVGTLTTTDQDVGNTFTYSIVGGDPVFSISGSTLKTTTSFDFETKPSYSVIIQTTDQDGLTCTRPFTINVKDVNEAPINITLSNNNIDENRPVGSAVGNLSSSDPDVDNTFTYSIQPGTDAGFFNISGTTLKTVSIFDFETKPSYKITIRTTDQDGLSYDQNFTINVNDVNEPPVVTAGGSATFNENICNGCTVITAKGVDPDIPPQTVTYSIVGGADLSLFNINNTTGVVTFITSPNYEAPTDADHNNTYDIIVRYSDGTLYTDAAMTFTIQDANDPPNFTSYSGNNTTATISIPENTATATVITQVSATDEDTNPAWKNFTYSLTQPDASLFNIDATGAITFKTSPNFEVPANGSTNNLYILGVRASNDATHYSEQYFFFYVTDVNEAPVITSNGGGAVASVSINENTTAVTTVTAADPDAGTTLVYSLTGGSDRLKFNINSSTGVLTFASAPDFETPTDNGGNNVYDVQVTVSDGTLPDAQDIAVTVLNVNEAPVITSNGGGAAASVSINENTTAVTTVAASDPDAGTTLVYSITGGSDRLKFNINSSTGALTFASAPDFETPTDNGGNNVYDVHVTVSDGTLSDAQDIAVTVLNVNETPTDITLSNNTVSENQPVGTTVGNFSTTDPDVGNTFTYSILPVFDAAVFSLSGAKGATLQTNAIFDYETRQSYQITIRTTDQGDSIFDKTFTINIQNINEPPTDISLSNNTVAENQSSGTAVGNLSTIDPDGTGTFTYSIRPVDDAASFTISGNTLQTSASFIYEAKSSYSVTIRTTDQVNLNLHFDKTFNIYVVCNLRSVFDWSIFPNGNNPDKKMYTEAGLPVSFHLNDPHNIVNVFNTNNRFQGTRSLVWQQSPNNISEISSVTVSFGLTANQICLNLLNVDYSGSNKDSLIIDPYFNGSKRTLNANEYTISSAVTFKGNNTFVGNSNVGNPSTLGNMEVCILPGADSIRISYGNGNNPPGNNQSIGISNFTWCEITNRAPEFINSSGNNIATSRDTCYENILFRKHLRFRDIDMDSVTILKAVPKHGAVQSISMADSSFSYKANPNYSGYDTISVVIKDNRTFPLTDTLTMYMYIIPINFPANTRIDCSGDTAVIKTGKASPAIIAHSLPVVVTYQTVSTQNTDPASFSYYNYTLTRTWHVTDIAGNSCSHDQMITVSDTTRPAISGRPGNIEVYNTSSACDVMVNWTEPAASDNCTATGALLWTKSHLPGSSFNVGTTTVSYNVTDVSGNKDSCSFTITVRDTIKPTITPPADLIVNADAISHTASGVVLGSPVTADNCGVATITNNSPATYPAGITVVTWIVTDIHGNTATTTQRISVIDDYPPVITSSSDATIPENTTGVMTITATDPDVGNTLSFSIIGGLDASKFSINQTSGALTFKTAPDYELPGDANKDNIYIVDVTVADNYELTDTATITVTVANVNDSPADILLSKSNVDEHLPSGSFVGTLTTIDEDLGDSHTYSLSGADASFFGINGDSLITTTTFNYLTQKVFSIIIRTTDGSGAFFEKPFNITVNNINEAPVILTINNTPADTLNFDAYSGETTSVCLNVTDPDTDETSISALYSINGSGTVTVEANNHNCFNYTPANGFVGKEILFVTVCDNGTPSLCDTVTVVMSVVPRFLFSQVISPNGDGINDTWVCGGLERYPDNTITIFSRWGDIVYKAHGYDNVNIVWKGDYNYDKSSYKGAVPNGTYFYIIELGNGSKLTGFIVLNH
jgi:gliding motility-associated-like protein